MVGLAMEGGRGPAIRGWVGMGFARMGQDRSGEAVMGHFGLAT